MGIFRQRPGIMLALLADHLEKANMSDEPFRFNSLVFAVPTPYQHSMKLIPLALLTPMIMLASDFPAPFSLPVVSTLPDPFRSAGFCRPHTVSALHETHPSRAADPDDHVGQRFPCAFLLARRVHATRSARGVRWHRDQDARAVGDRAPARAARAV